MYNYSSPNEQDEMKVELTEMKDEMTAIERKQDEVKVPVGQYILTFLD